MSAHVRMYEFKWLCSPLALDFDDLLLVPGLDACGAHRVVFCISII